MNDLLTNIATLVYIGAVLVHKLLGYSYFTAAWRSLIFVAALGIVLVLGIWGYHFALNQIEPENPEFQHSQPDSNA